MSYTDVNLLNPALNPRAPFATPGVPVPQPIDVQTSHKVLVGLLVLIVVGMVLTEGAGHSKDSATLVILALVGVFMMEGMTHASQFASFATNNPYNPLQA